MSLAVSRVSKWEDWVKSGSDWYLGPRGGKDLLVLYLKQNEDLQCLFRVFTLEHCYILQSTIFDLLAWESWQIVSSCPPHNSKTFLVHWSFCGKICFYNIFVGTLFLTAGDSPGSNITKFKLGCCPVVEDSCHDWSRGNSPLRFIYNWLHQHSSLDWMFAL